jgi:hypothetical protein
MDEPTTSASVARRSTVGLLTATASGEGEGIRGLMGSSALTGEG